MLCDYHVHSTYCDGKSTPRENIESAISLGMDILGFSGHSCIEKATYSMSREGTEDYIREITSLKNEYRERITILCGLEKDFYSNDDESKFDYVIGSLHYVTDGERIYDVDHTPKITASIIEDVFGGDGLSYCESYYSTLSKLFDNVRADVIGHFDLVNKFSEKGIVFDTSSRRYINAVTDALDCLLIHNVPFEISTGAMSRGYRSVPYPSPEILKYIREKGGRIMFSSDSHDAKNLCFGFDIAKDIARECGFKSRVIITPDGKNDIEL